MRAVLALAVLSLATLAPAADDEKPDYDKLKAKWAEKVKEVAKFEADRYDERIKKAGNNKAQVDRLVKQKSEAAKREFALRPTDLKVGDFGKLGANHDTSEPPIFVVVKVVDKAAAVATWGDKFFLLETDTKGWTDDDKVKVTDYVHATDTRKVGGRTMLVLKVVK